MSANDARIVKARLLGKLIEAPWQKVTFLNVRHNVAKVLIDRPRFQNYYTETCEVLGFNEDTGMYYCVKVGENERAND